VKVKILYAIGWCLSRLIMSVLFRVRITGTEHIPDRGAFILASNHISFYDPPFLGASVRRELYFFAKKELFDNALFGAVLRRVNALPARRGSVDRRALDTSIRVLGQGRGLVMFPEGTRSMTGDLLPPRAGVGLIAARVRCPIVVAHVQGSNRLLDCFLGRQRLSVTFGEPILPDDYGELPAGKQAYIKITGMVMERIRRLKDGVEHLK